MRLPRLNLNISNDWKGDLTLCVRAMKKLVIFCAVVLAVTAAFLPVYRAASEGNQPYDVYSKEDWLVAVQDPFVDTIILHEDIGVTEIPNRKVRVITDF